MAEVVRIQLRRGTAAQWTQANPTLGEAEFGIETDTGKFKVGDGITAWNDIANYFEPGDLADYVTESDLATELADYVTDTDLTTTLGDYLTSSNASSTYQTQAAMSLYAALSGATFTGDVILNADPTENLGAATKQYVDNVAIGLQTKPAVKAATTTNLSGTYDNGTDGVGATLNLGQLATLDIDGVTSWELLDGILLKDQTDATENGRWVIDQIGNDTDTDWILRRCSLCDDASEIPGAYMFVADGDTNAGSGWVLTVADAATFVVGTDDITANEFTAGATYTAGDGISISGTTISVTADVIRDSDITDFITASSTTTLTNKTIDAGIFQQPFEKIDDIDSTLSNAKYQPNLLLNIDSSIGIVSTSNSTNFGLNLNGLVIPTGQTFTYVLIANQPTSGTPGNFTTLSVNGTGVSTLWSGGSVPSGTNGIDVYTFTIINPSGTQIALASMTSYSS